MRKIKKSTKSEQEILARNEESNRKWLEGNRKSKRAKYAFGFFPLRVLPRNTDSRP